MIADVALFLVEAVKAVIGFGLLAGIIAIVAGVVNSRGRRR